MRDRRSNRWLRIQSCYGESDGAAGGLLGFAKQDRNVYPKKISSAAAVGHRSAGTGILFACMEELSRRTACI
jgi:hypothetical protein